MHFLIIKNVNNVNKHNNVVKRTNCVLDVLGFN